MITIVAGATLFAFAIAALAGCIGAAALWQSLRCARFEPPVGNSPAGGFRVRALLCSARPC